MSFVLNSRLQYLTNLSGMLSLSVEILFNSLFSIITLYIAHFYVKLAFLKFLNETGQIF